ncbi:MAG: hypothetical protein ACRECT_02670 [Thermoplasmata archaeon]
MPRRSTFPRFAEKWRHPSWVTPHDFVSTYHPPVEAPARCRVVWNPSGSYAAFALDGSRGWGRRIGSPGGAARSV